MAYNAIPIMRSLLFKVLTGINLTQTYEKNFRGLKYLAKHYLNLLILGQKKYKQATIIRQDLIYDEF